MPRKNELFGNFNTILEIKPRSLVNYQSKGTIINHHKSLHGGSLEISLTVPSNQLEDLCCSISKISASEYIQYVGIQDIITYLFKESVFKSSNFPY